MAATTEDPRAPVEHRETQSRAAELAALSRSALTALLDLTPRAAWGAVRGGFIGFFLGGLLGLALSGGAALLFTLPSWLAWAQLVWVPMSLALAGGYIGAVNGLLSALNEELVRRGLAARLYAIVKPACVAAARKLGPGGQASPGPLEVSTALRRELDARLGDEDPEASPSLGARAARFLALRSRKLLCLAAVRGVVQAKDAAAARAELESLGVQKLELWMTETVEDLFFGQLMLVGAIALVAAALPALVYALGASIGG